MIKRGAVAILATLALAGCATVLPGDPQTMTTAAAQATYKRLMAPLESAARVLVVGLGNDPQAGSQACEPVTQSLGTAAHIAYVTAWPPKVQPAADDLVSALQSGLNLFESCSSGLILTGDDIQSRFDAINNAALEMDTALGLPPGT